MTGAHHPLRHQVHMAFTGAGHSVGETDREAPEALRPQVPCTQAPVMGEQGSEQA